ncbi:hypothetical protein KFE25_000882 [Diacronema lutheri]|uniref:F-box domain-containing protein n=1 Tax=Diacronema lutheri TaxID=2081491 RepID=A0A8J5XR92_DIALT|nr:hypothetical protein KFE25_000882 [Diacronema lutheri]
MALVQDFLSCRFPSELIVHIVRVIDCWDLVAMCRANPEWGALIDAERLWLKASQHRWPHVVGGPQQPLPGEPGDGAVFTTGPGPAPLATPPWAHTLDGSARWTLPSDCEFRRTRLPPPPAAGAPSDAWCRFYLTQEAFELMSVPTDEKFAAPRRARLSALERALRWCSPLVRHAVALGEDAAPALRQLRELRSLTIASAGDVTSAVGGAIAQMHDLESLVVVDSISSEHHAADVVGAVTQSCARLRELDIASATLNEEAWKYVLRGLRTAHTLHWLDSLSLVGCGLTDARCIELCRALAQQRALRHLNLSANCLTHAAIVGGIAILVSGEAEAAPSPKSSVVKPVTDGRASAPAPRAQRSIIALAAAVDAGATSLDVGGNGAGAGSGAGAAVDARADHASPSAALLAPLSLDDAAADSAPRAMDYGEHSRADGDGGGEPNGEGDAGAAARAAQPAWQRLTGHWGTASDGAAARAHAAAAETAADARASAADNARSTGSPAAPRAHGGNGGGTSADGAGARERARPACQLVSIDLSLNPLAAEGTAALAECLKRCASIERLTLQYVTLYSREAANLLGALLGADLPLTSLNLSFNYISACGSPVEQIAAQLGANHALRELRLRRCCIGGWRRARALARGLMSNSSLTAIDLSYNGLGAAQATQASSSSLSLAVGTLCQAFAKNASLRSVDLSHNALGDAGCAAVVQAALEGRSMAWLDLQSNGVSVRGLRAVTAQLAAGGHSWLPVALHTHARHVRVASANLATVAFDGAVATADAADAGAAGAAAAMADDARALGCSQPYSDGERLFCEWPVERGADGAARGSGGSQRGALCVDLQGNLTLSQLVVDAAEEAEAAAGALAARRLASPWEQAARVRAARDGAARTAPLERALTVDSTWCGGAPAVAALAPADAAPAGAPVDTAATAADAGDELAADGADVGADLPGGAGERPLASALAKRKERGWDAAAADAVAPAADGARAPSREPSAGLRLDEEHAMSLMLLRDAEDEEDEADGGGSVDGGGAAADSGGGAECGDANGARRARAPRAPRAAPAAAAAGTSAAADRPRRPLLSRAPPAVLREIAQHGFSLLPSPCHMSGQKEVNPSMRMILVDWLIELFEELQLPSHALLAGVHAVDRYLSAVAVHKESLQLVGAVSLMLCSNNYCKLLAQDGDPPELRGLATADDVVYWTDNTYTIDEVTAMEAKLMISLGLGLGGVSSAYRSPLDYLIKFAALLPLTDEMLSVAHEILLRSTREYQLLRYEPSLLAATVLVIAVRSCLAQSATRAEQQRQRALDGPVASFADAGGEKEARGAALPAPHDADDSPDERTLYACTGHSVAEQGLLGPLTAV